MPKGAPAADDIYSFYVMLAQILSGILLSAISFSFGYFLFRSQTKEQIRLEVYRRRLDTYEKIITFLDSLDAFAHREFVQSKKDGFVHRALDLITSTALYTPPELHSFLEILWDEIDSLPGSLAKLEESDTSIRIIIEEDIGLHLPNRIMELDKKRRRQMIR
jgi:hypothetical protein